MGKLLDRYCRLLEWTIGALLVVLVVLVFGNVVLRYGFNSGLVVTEELGRWIFVWMVFLGAVVGLREHAHLGSDFLVSRLGPRARRVCALAGASLMLYCTWLLLAGSWQQMLITRSNGAPVTGLSMAFFYGAGVVFAASALVILAVDTWRALTGRSDASDLLQVRESEEAIQARPPHRSNASEQGLNGRSNMAGRPA